MSIIDVTLIALGVMIFGVGVYIARKVETSRRTPKDWRERHQRWEEENKRKWEG